MVPIPGRSSVVSRALVRLAAAASIHSQSLLRAGAVVQAAAGEAVAVGHLDGIDAGGIEGGHDLPHVLGRDAVPDGMHAVAQGHVLDEELGR